MKKYLLLSAVALCVSAPAFAEDGMPPEGGKGSHGRGGDRFEKMVDHMFERDDLDKDGFVSKEEFLKSTEERFTGMDSDGDGKISKDEAKKHHGDKRAKWKEMKEKAQESKDAGAEEAASDAAPAAAPVEPEVKDVAPVEAVKPAE